MRRSEDCSLILQPFASFMQLSPGSFYPLQLCRPFVVLGCLVRLPIIYLELQNMSLAKQRVKSANAASFEQRPAKKRRYDRLVTESSQEYNRQPQSRMRSYSRDTSKRGKANHINQLANRQPERIVEENLNLKVFINDLQEQLSLQRGRLQMNKRKTQKYVKQFNREFDKELYYSGKNPTSYMFSGIKQQYENMKHLYQEKCLEVQRYAQTLEVTNFEEISSYVEALEDQNRLLKEKLDEIYTIKNETHSSKIKKANKQHKYSQIDRIYSDLNDNEEETQHRNRPYEEAVRQRGEGLTLNVYRQKCKDNEKEIRELKSRIVFLDKLLIQKGNSEHQANRQRKKIQKQKNQLAAQVKRLNELISESEKKYTKSLSQILQVQAKKTEIQCNIFKNALLEKNQHIQKLQKEIRFLTTMLSYWKPLDELGRNELFGNKQLSENDEYSAEPIKMKGNEVRKSSMASDHIMNSQFLQPNTFQNEHDRPMRSNTQEDSIKRSAGVRSQSQQNVVTMSREAKERVPQSCGRKWKSSAFKCRKVQPREIKQLGQLLRYRLIGNNFDTDRLRQLLDLSEPCLEEQRQFRLEYISMREIKNVLLQVPFCLSEEEAVLISRFIVEDQNIEHVYCDQDNEIKRTIAKSILKNLVGQYSLPNQQDILSEWERFKQQYLLNIQSALRSIAPKGIISEAKFLQLLTGLGIELKDQLRDWMIATMVIQSTSLRQLNYRTLVPQ